MSEHGLSVGKIPTAITAAIFRSHYVPSHRCFDAVGWATSTGSQAVCENLLWKFQIFAFCQSNLSCNAAEWLACWLRHRRAWVQIAAATLSGNSLRQTVHTHCASVHQAAKLVATLLRVARVTAGLAESNGLVYDSCHLQADCQEPRSALEPYTWQSSMGDLFYCQKTSQLNKIWQYEYHAMQLVDTTVTSKITDTAQQTWESVDI